jgi:sec-independent protein translocase protein TatA
VFGNLGVMQIVIILVVVLLLFGAKRLPEIGSSMGKGIREFKKSLTDVERSLSSDADERPRDRLPRNDAEPVRRDEEARPEPKRLIP